MLNTLWPIFIIISYIYAIFSGNIAAINNSVFESASTAVELSINFLGSLCLWNGIMQIAMKSSLTQKISKLLYPFMKFVFPDIKKTDKAYEEISMNITANMLGLGNAATPIGLKAMKTMQKNNPNKTILTNSMAFFILINTASLQIIPTTVIAIRSSLGSTNPTKIILAVWSSTILAALVAIISGKILSKKF